MFRKLHWQFTLFCTLITSLILVAMTCVCLYISQRDSERQSFLSFQNNVHSMVSYLESQSVISHKWLAQLGTNYGFQISVSDSGTPLLYSQLNYDSHAQSLFEAAQTQSLKEYHISDSLGNSNKLTQSSEFRLTANKNYYASVAIIPRDTGNLSVITLYSLMGEKQAQHRQFLIFSIAVVCAIFLLAVFSWFFTKHMLLPIEENRRRQTEFIAAASHELRSPLTVILSSLSAMKDAPPHKQLQFCDNITQEGQRMQRLISDMLVLANADNKNWSFHPTKVQPDTLLLDTYENYLPVARNRNITLNISLPEEVLPPRQWDGDRIMQVLGILTDNALHYTPSGGKVLLSVSATENQVQYRIWDNGIGIPDEEKELIFQRFYRGDKSHHVKEHFGLGLSIATEITKLHRGQLSVEDNPKGGSVFILTL